MIDKIYRIVEIFNLILLKTNIIKLPKVRGATHLIFSYGAYILCALVYKLNLNRMLYNIESKKNNKDKKVIVSLTTFPARIKTVHITISTILRQTLRPDMIILWLAESEFPNGLGSLPKELFDLQEKGLQIKFCDNLKPHKKYYYTMLEYPEDIIITIDDDILYPSFLIEDLMKLYDNHPGCICCTRGHEIVVKNDGEITPYSKWLKNHQKKEERPSFYICPTGVGGVLYPPNLLDHEVFNIENIKRLCLNADDLWLKIMSLKKHTKIVKSSKYGFDFLTVNNSQKNGLSNINVKLKKNDEQLGAILEEYPIKIVNENSVVFKINVDNY